MFSFVFTVVFTVIYVYSYRKKEQHLRKDAKNGDAVKAVRQVNSY